MGNGNGEETKGLRAKIKTELGFMKKGAKVLPKVVAKKGKGWLKGQIAASRERAREQREIDMITGEVEQAAYRKESILEAKRKGKARAREKSTGKGRRSGGIAELLGFQDLMGFGQDGKQPKRTAQRNELSGLGNIDIGGTILGDFAKKKKKRN